MHVAIARVITPDLVFYPATAFENVDAGSVLLDRKNGGRIRTMTDASVAMASPEQRSIFSSSRAWFCQGLVDGEPQTWLVLATGGCGCGSTGELGTTGQQLDWLAMAPNPVA